jgi:hypothetical protein
MTVVSAAALDDDDTGPFDVAVVQREGPVRHQADIVISLQRETPDTTVAYISGRSERRCAVADLDGLFEMIEHLVSDRPGPVPAAEALQA